MVESFILFNKFCFQFQAFQLEGLEGAEEILQIFISFMHDKNFRHRYKIRRVKKQLWEEIVIN